MDQLQSWRVFCQVAELRSFHLAADKLELSTTYVSNVIRKLEQQLGCRLLARTTRTVQLTADGALFLTRCGELLQQAEQLSGMFRARQGQLAGRLRLDMPTGIARDLVLPALPAVVAAHPQLHIELCSADRKVDLVAEGIDLTLRIGSIGDDSLVARPLGFAAQAIAASPAYLARCGVPQDVDALSRHQMVHYVTRHGAQDAGLAVLQQNTVRYVRLAGNLTVDNADGYTQACLQGLGLIQSPRLGLARYFASGELIEVLPDIAQPALPVSLLYPHRRHLTDRLHFALHWMQQLLSPYLTQHPLDGMTASAQI